MGGGWGWLNAAPLGYHTLEQQFSPIFEQCSTDRQTFSFLVSDINQMQNGSVSVTRINAVLEIGVALVIAVFLVDDF